MDFFKAFFFAFFPLGVREEYRILKELAAAPNYIYLSKLAPYTGFRSPPRRGCGSDSEKNPTEKTESGSILWKLDVDCQYICDIFCNPLIKEYWNNKVWSWKFLLKPDPGSQPSEIIEDWIILHWYPSPALLCPPYFLQVRKIIINK